MASSSKVGRIRDSQLRDARSKLAEATNKYNNEEICVQSFKSFLAESTKEVPFDKNPHVGWWKDKAEKDGYHTVYHGTHKKNLDSILKHGLNHRDPRTGMISVTHDPHTAHGYAAMSGSGGERNFRKAGAKAVHTPHEDRVVLKMHIPKEFVDKHMDHEFHGNPKHGNRTKMADKSHYDSWKKSNPDKPDHEFYQVSELRLNKEIPHHYIVGYSHKVKK